MPFAPTRAVVESEGCKLHYWYQGSGPVLILISGGNGLGRVWNKTFEHLDRHFTVCAFDRRQHGDSAVEEKQLVNPVQQCRDVLAIIEDLGFSKTSMLGTSGGGVLAFQFAVSFPQWLEHVIVHEAPTMTLLDDSSHWINWLFGLLDKYQRQGSLAAQAEFDKEMQGFEDTPPLTKPSDQDRANFWANELLQFALYCPDLRQIAATKASIMIAVGVRSSDAPYARTTYPQADILGCARFMMPGHHMGYESEPGAFSRELVEAFDEMDREQPRWSSKSSVRSVISGSIP